MLALSISFCLFFPLEHPLAHVAKAPSLGIFLGEVVIGLFMGLLVRMAVLALETAGAAMSMFSGLHLGSFFSPLFPQGESPYGTFLTMTMITLMFLGDMHHWILKGVVESYRLCEPGAPLPLLQFASFADWVNRCFILSLQLAAPFLVTQLLFFLGVGLVNRLVAQMQVYFLSQPIQILMGLAMLAISLPLVTKTFFTFFAGAIFPRFVASPAG